MQRREILAAEEILRSILKKLGAGELTASPRVIARLEGLSPAFKRLPVDV